MATARLSGACSDASQRSSNSQRNGTSDAVAVDLANGKTTAVYQEVLGQEILDPRDSSQPPLNTSSTFEAIFTLVICIGSATTCIAILALNGGVWPDSSCGNSTCIFP